MEVREIPLEARVRIAHACLEVLADGAGLDLLHLKGPTLDADLGRPGRVSADADVLVRPDHLTAFTTLLSDHGWRRLTDFRRGSPFAHAANFHHPNWGLVDVHRHWPGFEVPAEEAFEVLWSERRDVELAGVACPTTSRPAQVLMLALHAARGGDVTAAHDDLRLGWHAVSDADREAARRLVDRLDAHLALAVVLGEDDHVDPARAALWRHLRDGGSRRAEWRARWRSAAGPRAKFEVLRLSLRPDLDHLAWKTGRRPTRWEAVRYSVGRVARALSFGRGRGGGA